ncbi:hypothetical protein L596_029474 [Steinernema carpocapsae]|uniref:Piwi domain-containing protein n=1 Tax=Steinernema carpocapsae TaxID=34508 RepID=A0A4U5LUR3_STECR|nr:hypothetical protein L596_029474 [Steinernema carpocapsae]
MNKSSKIAAMPSFKKKRPAENDDSPAPKRPAEKARRSQREEAPRRSHGGSKILMNGFRVEIEKAMTIHKYYIQLNGIFKKRGGEEIARDLTEGVHRDDVSMQRKRRGCWDVFRQIVKENESLFGGNTHKFVYDCGRLFCSMEEIFPKSETKTGTVDLATLPDRSQTFYRGALRIEWTIKKVEDGTFKLGVPEEARSSDRSAQQFLEILTSQGLYARGDDHLIFRNQRYDVQENAPVDKKSTYPFCVRQGVQKSVILCESAEKIATILQLEKKTSPFFPEMNLLDFVRQCSSDDKAMAVLKGLQVQTTHLKRQQKTFRISGYSNTACKDIHFENRDGEKISVPEYFLKHHAFRTAAGQLPCVEEKRKPQNNHYPMDCLKIVGGQRILSQKQEPEIVEHLISTARILPLKMADEIGEQLGKHILNREAETFLRTFKVNVDRNLLETEATLIKAPQIQYGKNQNGVNPAKTLTTERGQKNAWKMEDSLTFYRPGVVSDSGEAHRWMFVILNEPNQREHGDCRVFLEKFVARAGTRGIKIQFPHVEKKRIENSDPWPELQEIGQYAKSNGVKFVMFVYERTGDIRKAMKLLETTFALTTQHVSLKTISKAAGDKGAFMVLDNLLMKTNEKLGGLNTRVKAEPRVAEWFERGTTMFMGFDVSHPGLGARNENGVTPTAVGMSFTKNSDLEVVGRLWYQEPREHLIPNMKDHIVEALETFKKHSGKFPELVVVFRGGVSEGEYEKVQTKEVQEFQDAFQQLKFSRKPILKIVVVQRNSGYRLMPAQRNDFGYQKNEALVQNVVPGTCADAEIVDQKRTEFVLVPHQAIQGTAKPSKYVLLHDEAPKMSKEELSTIAHTLCFMHGIVTSPVSCPSILYQAGDLAKRASCNFKAFLNRKGGNVPIPPVEEKEKRKEFFDALCEKLKITLDTRFWA